ncbi:MAG: regulatory protein RecX [Gordonia sp. (in: high G+C Gram-positive bacteria)]
MPADPEEKAGPSAWDAALRLLGVRARSRSEMTQRLRHRGFDEDTVADVMARLDRAKLLDDEEFAAEWVRSRHTNSGRGRVALRHELAGKGIDSAIVERVLADIDTDDERDTAAALVARKLTGAVVAELTADAGDRSARDKYFRRLAAMLMRRGYPQSIAIEVVTEALDTVTASTR